MNIQSISLLNHLKKNLDELIEVCKPRGRLADHPRKLVTGMSSRAHWLRNAIVAFEEDAEKNPPRRAV
jgi:hypothetical protein